MGDPRDPVARRLQRRAARQPLEKTLFACDELAGFVTAAALVRPSKSVLDLEAASVVKRMKDKAFARGVKREDLRAGAELLGLPLDEHIGNVIGFMREQADALGPDGGSALNRRTSVVLASDLLSVGLRILHAVNG